MLQFLCIFSDLSAFKAHRAKCDLFKLTAKNIKCTKISFGSNHWCPSVLNIKMEKIFSCQLFKISWHNAAFLEKYIFLAYELNCLI